MGTYNLFRGLAVLVGAVLLCTAAQAATLSAIVSTDTLDYAPGDTVYIEGAGYWANESVQLQVHLQVGLPEPENAQFYEPWTVTADGEGSISAIWIVPDDAVNKTLYVDALGLSSGLTATATFTDCNVLLAFTTGLPDSVCAGRPLEVCANLAENCGGGNRAPLANRRVLFFVNTGNCGADVGQLAQDSATTDANGNACVTFAMPVATGQYSIRIKFRGEPKPSKYQSPNSACNPTQRIELSSTNECKAFKVVANYGTAPVVTMPANRTVGQCGPQQICLPVQIVDPNCDIDTVVSNLGVYAGNESNYDQVSYLRQLGGTVTQVGGGQPGKALFVAGDFVSPVNASSGVTVTLPNFVFVSSIVSYGSFPSGVGPAQSADQLKGVPTDLTFTLPGAGGPDGGLGDGSVDFSSGNYVTVGFSSTIRTCNGSNSDFVIFSNSDGGGTALLQFKLSGTVVYSFTGTVPGGTSGSGTGGVAFDLPDGLPFNQVYIKCTSGVIEIDGFGARTAPSSTSSDVCFTADTAGVYTVIVTATDQCGHVGADTTLVTVVINRPPVANAGADFTKFLCSLGQVCFPVSFTDPDNNIKSTQLLSGPGTLAGNQICYTPGAAGASTFVIKVTDSCNAVDLDTVVVTIGLNAAPVAVNPPNQTVFQCASAQICYNFTAADPNGGTLSWTKLAGSGTVTSGGQFCFTPTISGTYAVTAVVSDSCGAKDTTSISYTVTLNSAPVAVNPTTPVNLIQCTPAQVCYTFAASDVNGGTLSWTKLTGTGTLTSGGQWCFTPASSGAYAITAVVADSCGAKDTTTLTYNVTLNGAPTITLANDTTIFLCAPTQICRSYAVSDPNGTSKLTEVLVSGFGAIDTAANTVCFTPSASGTYQIVTSVTDSCGAYDLDTVVVTVTMGQYADVTCPSSAAYFICAPTSICRPVTVTPASATVTISPIGTYSAGNVCFAADTSGTYVLRVIATTGCSADTCFVTTTVTKNSAPVAVNPPTPVSVFQCVPAQICYTFTAADVNGGTLTWSKLSGTGTVSAGGQWCFTPAGNGNYAVSAVVADSCGAKDTVNLTYNVTVNSAPSLTLANDTTVHLCTPVEICRSFTVSDPNGSSGLTKTLISGYGTLDAVNNKVCFTPSSAGSYQFIVQVSDSCGLSARDTVNVTVTFGPVAVIDCPTGPINITECAGGQICQALTITPANATVTTTLGTFSGGQLCFNAPASGTYTARVIATAECGADTCDITFNVTVSQPPVLVCPPEQTIFICGPGSLCIAVGGAPVATYTVTPIGSYVGGNVICPADTSGTYILKVKASTPCGTDSCFITAHVTINSAPVAANPRLPATIFQCTPTEVCTQFTATDINGGTLTWTRLSGSGSVSTSGNWCFTPTGTGTYSVVAQVADSCGAADTVSLSYDIVINGAPSITIAGDTTVNLCTPAQICRSFVTSDPNNNIQSVTLISGSGTISGNQICFTPSTGGTYSFIAQVSDSCGVTARDTVHVTVTFGEFADVTCPPAASYFICAPTSLCRPVTVTPASATVTVSPIGSYSAGQLCFTADTSGTYVIRVIAGTGCSADTCYVSTTVTRNSAPVAVNPTTPVNVFQCVATQVCYSFSAADVNGGTLTWSRISGAGSVAADGQWCFTPAGSGAYSVVAQVADSCGAADTVTVTYNVTINAVPVLTLANDTSLFQCAAAQICLPYTVSDANGNLQAVTLLSGSGTLNAGQLCFTPTVAGVYTLVAQALDSCGATAVDTLRVTVTLNRAPVVNAGPDQTIFQCEIQQICWPAGATDPDGNLTTVQLVNSPGTYSGGQICFTPTGTLNYEFVLKATDACGLISYDTVVIYYTHNSAPVANAGRDSTVVLCAPQAICWVAGSSDVNGNLTATNLIAGPGSFDGSQICFTPSTSGTYTFILEAIDACGKTDVDTSVIYITLNAAPVCVVPNDTVIYQCTPTQVCLPAYATDNNLLSCEITSGPGMLTGGNWCYTPSAQSQVVTVGIQCTDSCGATCTESFTVDFRINSKPTIEFASYNPFFLCGPQQVCLQFTATDNDSPTPVITLAGGGTLDLANSQVCFNADTTGTYHFILTITDNCGATAADTIDAVVTVNQAPVAVLPADTNVFQCTPTQICLPAACTDPDNNQNVCDFSGPGTFNGSQICFTPNASGSYVFVLHVEDACGLEADDTVTVTVVLNSVPVVTLPADSAVFQCTLSPICLNYNVSDADGTSGLTETMISGFGSINTATNEICFTPSGAGSYQFIVGVVDSCGGSDQDTVVITVTTGQGADIACPSGPIAVSLCAAGPVCQTLEITPSTATVTTTLGTYSGGQLCFDAAVSGTYTATVIATTSCGADTCQVTFNVTIGSVPQLSCPGVTSKFLCSAGQVCIPVGVMGGGTVTVSPIGTYNSGDVCFTADTTGHYVLRVIATSACGADTCDLEVNVQIDRAPVATEVTPVDTFVCATGGQVCRQLAATDPDGNGLTWSRLTGSGTVSASGQWCFTISAAGTYTVTAAVADSCGKADTITATYNVTVNSAPVVTLGADTTVFQCATGPVCIPFTITDANNNISIRFVKLDGTVADTNAVSPYCFTPIGAGVHQIIVLATDACGAGDADTITVNVLQNRPPVANAGPDQSLKLCTPTQVCWPASCTDPDNNLDSCKLISGPGTYAGGQICFTPGSSGTYTFITRAVDHCGVADQDTVVITIALNTPPVCQMPPADTTVVFQCTPTQITIPVGATDPNGNFSHCELLAGPGSLVGGNWVFTPTVDQLVKVKVQCSDSCGASCIDSFFVKINLNAAPVANAGRDTTVFACGTASVCITAGCTDEDNNLSTCELLSPFGTYDSNTGKICLTAPNGDGSDKVYQFILKATDACGAVDYDTSVVTVNFNAAPVITPLPDFTAYLEAVGEVCFDITVNDPDLNVGSVTVSPLGTYANGQVCFNADTTGTYCLELTATDQCGLIDKDTICVKVQIDECIHVQIEKVHDAFQGQHSLVDIFLNGSGKPLGGFSFLIAYDATALTPYTVTPGSLFEGCGWEYFTFGTAPTATAATAVRAGCCVSPVSLRRTTERTIRAVSLTVR